MRKLILLIISVISLTNVSYASFPVSDTLKVKKDTIQTETVEQYHLRIQKMGFDIEDCSCKTCNQGLEPKVRTEKDIWKLIIRIFSILGIISYLLFRIIFLPMFFPDEVLLTYVNDILVSIFLLTGLRYSSL